MNLRPAYYIKPNIDPDSIDDLTDGYYWFVFDTWQTYANTTGGTWYSGGGLPVNVIAELARAYRVLNVTAGCEIWFLYEVYPDIRTIGFISEYYNQGWRKVDGRKFISGKAFRFNSGMSEAVFYHFAQEIEPEIDNVVVKSPCRQ